MNNLHRELAPISDAAWQQIEDEATRTLKRHLAARRVVDVHGPSGFDLSAIGTGHVARVEPVLESVDARVREVRRWSSCWSRLNWIVRRLTTWSAAHRTPTGKASKTRRGSLRSPRIAPCSTASPWRTSRGFARVRAIRLPPYQ